MPRVTNISGARRILVYGVCGSGKTTLARQLSEATGIPWHGVDDLAFEPGWRPTTEEFQRAEIEKIITADRWILDTAYGKWLELPLGQADVIVALDYPRQPVLDRCQMRSPTPDGHPVHEEHGRDRPSGFADCLRLHLHVQQSLRLTRRP